MSDTQWEIMTTNPRDNISQKNTRMNMEQKDSVNGMSIIRNIEQPSQESDACTRTGYKRVIWKLDRLTY